MRLSEKTSIANNLFSIIAAVCIAVWAVYVTWIKNEERIADLQVVELEQKTELRSKVISDMSIDIIRKDSEGITLSIDVSLENVGTEDVRISLDKRAMLISTIIFKSNTPLFRNPSYIGDSRFLGFDKLVGHFIDVGPNERYRISYVTKVQSSGLYLLRFLTKIESPSVQARFLKNFGRASSEVFSYSTGIDRIINVE